jgi:hypothetical protein
MAIPRPAPRPAGEPAPEPASSRPITQRPPLATRATATVGPAKFSRATGEPTGRIIVSVCGDEKTGKDHFGLTFPEPIYLHSFDQGLEGVINKFAKEKEIFVAEYELEIQPGEAEPKQVAEGANLVWENFRTNYRDSLEQCGEGTVILDTDTEVYELLRLARFGRLTQVMPHHYGPVNSEFRDLIRSAYDHKCNLFLIGRMSDEWINDASGKGNKTGNRIRRGFGDLPYLTQVNAICERVDLEGGGSDFQVTIDSCRFTPSANGSVTSNEYEPFRLAAFGE